MSHNFDPIDLEVLRTRLMNIQDEADAVVRRTAFSTAFTGAKDFGSSLTDHLGNGIASGVEGLAQFSIALPNTLREILKIFPRETWSQGDHIITNDAWIVLGHYGDICVCTPIFHNDKLIGFAINAGHTADMGGSLNWSGAQEAYEEALQIPPLKLYSKGVPDQNLIAMIRKNVRVPDQVMGDFQALINGNLTTSRLVQELMGEYKLESLTPLALAFQENAERTLRSLLSRIPDGEYTAEIDMDGAHEPLKFKVKINIEGDDITVDYSESPQQLERGGINAPFCISEADTIYPLLMLLLPEQESEGARRPLRVIAPEGSIFNCVYPASTWGRITTTSFIHPAIHSALSSVLADKVQSGSGFHTFVRMWGIDGNEKIFADNVLDGGGQGAMHDRDGAHVVAFPTQAANVSIEIFETRCPVQYIEKKIRQDSCGSGRYRGGCGISFTFRAVPGQKKPIKVSSLVRNLRTQPIGLQGGRSGLESRVVVNGITLRTDKGPAADGFVLLEEGQELTIETAGGGGFGNPTERERSKIITDLEYGYVSKEYAKSNYGLSDEEIELIGEGDGK